MNQSEYGPSYQEHLLEQYKLYVEMADRVSQRRARANSFFLALHTGLFSLATGLVGFSTGATLDVRASLAAAIFGIPFALVWLRVLRSYRQVNSAKYKIIHELESLLPCSPYKNEWEKVGQGRNSKLYRPLSHVESWIPILFVIGYLGVAVLALFIRF